MDMEVAGKKVLVFGSGISGIGAAALLVKQGAEVVLYDGNEKLTEAEVREKLSGDRSSGGGADARARDPDHWRGGACL